MAVGHLWATSAAAAADAADAADQAGPGLVRPRHEMPCAWADAVVSLLADVSDDEASRGAAPGATAIDLLAGPRAERGVGVCSGASDDVRCVEGAWEALRS